MSIQVYHTDVCNSRDFMVTEPHYSRTHFWMKNVQLAIVYRKQLSQLAQLTVLKQSSWLMRLFYDYKSQYFVHRQLKYF